DLKYYNNLYPETKLFKDDFEKLSKSLISNLQNNDIEQRKLRNEYSVLKEIQEELPNVMYLRKVHEVALREQQQLRDFKKLALLKVKVEQLITVEQSVRDKRIALKSLISKQEKSEAKVASLKNKRDFLVSIIESINIQLDIFSLQSGFEFLSEIEPKIVEADFKILNISFITMFKEYQLIDQKKSIETNLLIQSKALEESIKQIESTDQAYISFLSSLNQYISMISEEFKICPACGTEGINKEYILSNIERSQLKVNENLPKLEKTLIQTKVHLREIVEGIKLANTRIEESKQSVKEIVDKFTTDLKNIDLACYAEHQSQQILQQEIDLSKSHLKQFEEECTLLGLDFDDNIGEKLEIQKNKLLNEISNFKINSYLGLVSKEEKLDLKSNISQINEYEQSLQQIIVTQEIEMNRVNRLINESEIINIDIKVAELDTVTSNLEVEMKKLEQKLINIAKVEATIINIQSMIELNTDATRLLKLQKELISMKNQVAELENKEEAMNKDLSYLLHLINKSNEALSNLNEKVFFNLKETIQTIFEQINSHPLFTKLDLTLDTYRNNNCLTINVSKIQDTDEIKANASYVLSSAQVNSIALSIFLAMSLKQKWSPLNLIGLDDPIQSMDEVNIISFIDLIRLFVDKHKKQIIISTHDQSFHKLLLKKFRYYNIATIEYEAYGDKGPILKMSNKDYPSYQTQLERYYEQAKVGLLALDRKQ
uniref:hypothetical protein n=1 Tax=Metasolibacillus meyeri TaxID=1071052 RepID=UPI00187D1373